MTDDLQRLRAGDLAGARVLRIAAGLEHFPREVFDLADTLEVLDLSGNRLSALPDDLHRLHRLKVFFASFNRFTELPAALGDCPQLEMVGFKANHIAHVPARALPERLRWLILTDNAITELPGALGERPRLQKLMLAGNLLRTLPDTLGQCRPLELLRIAANRIENLPDWLAGLPRLAWLAIGGNAFNEAAEELARCSQAAGPVDWSRLQLGELLGEGASGRIMAGRLEGATGMREVAVKLFKGEVTSDGWPLTEMAASLAAGEHPRLIPVLGRLDGHPDGVQGLVMERISADYRTLAGPPSFESCTRDVYPPGLRLPASVALRIAADVASALAHLHGQGLVHGDLYAHNLLWHPDAPAGQATGLLGDFGAAAFAPPGTLGDALRRMDVRAFGVLLAELCAHADIPLAGRDAPALARDCLHEEPAARPDAAALAARCAQWAAG
ncbi:leucine-rich repeat-containing serine/threonine-protein kinase [Acidovorax sp. NCPPB 3859]|nr:MULTISPECIES: leucine-rich repeat-containing protein kinase family protein [unclassified Acidovorax]MDA8452717.1 leucine-rich repeat-containing serine/threonine-protein kinase [Acidovorax sp. GBBC 3297]MDA8462124.1 leucine-rich repeat-containing serine/threonine-protein kinase [Acidovorax sp. GBBC 3333]MDA8467169.1 leucine-rich repeat-containing serine/threonine-protein kinase [Acidovorax sp. GBBC 3332]MDA8472204.1 leucine-rich repeat-containing serine/threonine-protein kinase [Acidovorax sp